MMPPTTRSRRGLQAALAASGVLLLLCGLAASASASTQPDRGKPPVVTTSLGSLRGAIVGNADTFLGVPYAAPPVKNLRFAPPAPVAPWKGTRDATRQAPACVQFAPGGVKEIQATSEDCLYLDLYRPHRPGPTAKLPVIVWIHGGGFTQGTGVIYGGQTLAAQTGSVVISINYRLGAFGSLALSQLDTGYPSTGSGNWGILDQIAALKWVKRNAAAFGGDPSNVTIAGQSAGGASVCTLLASPQAAGLFARATIQSAGCGLGERTLAVAQEQGSAFADKAGCPDGNAQLACLRSAWTPNLVAAFQSVSSAGPVVGTPVLPQPSMQAFTDNAWNKVPVLIGGMAHEGKLFLSGTPDVTAADYQKWLDSFGSNAAKVAARYPLSDYPAPFYAEAQAFGDNLIFCGSDRTATLLATKTTVYRYEFDDPKSPTLYGFQPKGIDMSSTHSAELAYLFNFTLGAKPVPQSSRPLAAQMRTYWGAFAQDANPNTRGLPGWPLYRPATHRTLILTPHAIRVSTTVSKSHNCDFWANPDAAS